MNNPAGISTPVTLCLDQIGVPYRVFQHKRAIHSLREAAAERGQRPEQIIRSIVFRLSKGGFVMVLVAGDKQVSWQALRHHLGTSRISMATEAEVLDVTGYPLGAVAPYATRRPLRLLADEGVFHESEVSIGSGVRYTAVILKRDDFIRSLGPVEVGDFASAEE